MTLLSMVVENEVNTKRVDNSAKQMKWLEKAKAPVC